MDGTTAQVYLGQAKTTLPDPKSGYFAQVHGLGRRVPRQIRRARQCRYSARCESRAHVRRRRHRPVPHGTHVLRRGSHPVHAGHDSGARRKIAQARRCRSCCPCSARISPACSKPMDGFPVVIRTLDPPLHEFLPKREDLMVDLARLPYADTKAKKEMSAKYSIPVGELKKAPAGAAASRGRAARVQPDARPSRLPPWHHLSRDHRNAGARHLRSGRPGREEGHQGDSRSDDPAGRQRQRGRKSEADR